MYCRAKIEDMKERARTITKNDIYEIVGKRPGDIVVTEACGKVCLEIHMGEDMPEDAVQYTYRLLNLVAARLGTDLLDLREKVYDEGCDTCTHNRDLGWTIWARPMGEENA